MIKKITALILSAAMILTAAAYLTGCSNDGTRVSFAGQSYSTDTVTIAEMLPALGHPEKSYWKLRTFGSGMAACIGPTSYRLTGFAVTDAVDKLSNLKSKEAGEIDYPEGIDPSITGFTEFNWVKYPDFTAELLGNNYIGLALVDVNKRLIYFDVENL